MLKTVTRLVALAVVIGSSPATACTFCSPVSGTTLLTDLDQADTAYIAELTRPTPVRANPTAFDFLNRERQKGEAGFIARTVLRGDSAVNPGDALTVPLRIPGPSATLHLITHNSSEDRWRSYRLSDDSLKFVLGAAALPRLALKEASPGSIVSRLEYCLPFLGTDDFQLRKAIFAEFAQAPYSSLERLKPRLDRELVHQWMRAATRRAEEARQVFLLLSVGGDETDVPMLEREFQQCIESNWAGTLDGVILAYISLGGSPALDDIDSRLLSSPDRSVELKESAAKALRFLIEHETVNISRPRLLTSCRLLLHDPKTTDLIVQDLARWEDWPLTGPFRVDRDEPEVLENARFK